MWEHMRVFVVPFEDRGELGGLAIRPTENARPPLNLQGMTLMPMRNRLQALHSEGREERVTPMLRHRHKSTWSLAVCA